MDQAPTNKYLGYSLAGCFFEVWKICRFHKSVRAIRWAEAEHLLSKIPCHWLPIEEASGCSSGSLIVILRSSGCRDENFERQRGMPMNPKYWIPVSALPLFAKVLLSLRYFIWWRKLKPPATLCLPPPQACREDQKEGRAVSPPSYSFCTIEDWTVSDHGTKTGFFLAVCL